MSERITDERLAELLAEEKEIAESDLVLHLEASWAAEVAQALTELTERRAADAAGTVVYSIMRDGRHAGRYGVPLYSDENPAGWPDAAPLGVPVRATLGPWVEVTDDGE